MKPKINNPPAPEISRGWRGLIPYLLMTAAVFAAYILFPPETALHGHAGQYLMAAGSALLILTYAVGYIAGWFHKKDLVTFIMICGVLLRIGYMLYTGYSVRSHDVVGENGHEEYIMRLYEHFQLPDSYERQYYHPPLLHFLSAGVMKLFSLFTDNWEFLINTTKIVPTIASCACIPVCCRICRACGMSRVGVGVATAIISFHPTFFILSANINNDMLMVLLLFCAFLYTLKWYVSGCMKDIVILAIFIGLAMMAKLSGGMIAAVTGCVFLLVLIRTAKSREKGAVKRLFLQFGVFAAIAFPLGLWYSVRNFIKFGQPFGFVHNIGLSHPIYTGDISFGERFFAFSLTDCLAEPLCHPFRPDHRVWEFMLKSSLFGEYTFAGPACLAATLVLIGFLLVLVSLAAMAYVLIRSAKNKTYPLLQAPVGALGKWMLFLLWGSQLFSFISFNIGFPFACTMDFRYIVPTLLTGAAFIGFLYPEKKSETEVPVAAGRTTGFAAAVRCGVFVLAVLFCLVSAVFYMLTS